jgi:hypothetical protein
VRVSVCACVGGENRPVLKQQAMPVPAVIVPVYTMGMAREGTWGGADRYLCCTRKSSSAN